MSATRTRPVSERLWRKVDKSGECWVWTGAKNAKGYGVIWSGRGTVNVTVHRLSYELLVGPVAAGCVVHHACRNTLCVNPEHLVAITNGEHSHLHKSRPESDAEALRLRREGLMFHEIGSVLGVSKHAAWTRCRRALRREQGLSVRGRWWAS